MSYSGFLGFVCGIAAGIALVVIRARMSLKRGDPVEADEMTRSVYQKAAALSFYSTGGIAFIGWVIDNVLRHSRGEAVQVLSPWGIMVFSMLYLLLI